MSPYDENWLGEPLTLTWHVGRVNIGHMYTFEHVRLMCAMAAHEANRIYCRATGDLSQVSWDDALEHQRESALKGVDAVFAGKGPQQLHESWVEEKTSAGWVYGDVKDPVKKTHPCLVPYHVLPELQKWKDVIFLNAVHTMALALGNRVPGAVPVLDDQALQVTADRFSVKSRPA